MLAEKKGIPWVLIPDYSKDRFTLRNIARREDKDGLDSETAAALIRNSI